MSTNKSIEEMCRPATRVTSPARGPSETSPDKVTAQAHVDMERHGVGVWTPRCSLGTSRCSLGAEGIIGQDLGTFSGPGDGLGDGLVNVDPSGYTWVQAPLRPTDSLAETLNNVSLTVLHDTVSQDEEGLHWTELVSLTSQSLSSPTSRNAVAYFHEDSIAWFPSERASWSQEEAVFESRLVSNTSGSYPIPETAGEFHGTCTELQSETGLSLERDHLEFFEQSESYGRVAVGEVSRPCPMYNAFETFSNAANWSSPVWSTKSEEPEDDRIWSSLRRITNLSFDDGIEEMCYLGPPMDLAVGLGAAESPEARSSGAKITPARRNAASVVNQYRRDADDTVRSLQERPQNLEISDGGANAACTVYEPSLSDELESSYEIVDDGGMASDAAESPIAGVSPADISVVSSKGSLILSSEGSKSPVLTFEEALMFLDTTGGSTLNSSIEDHFLDHSGAVHLTCDRAFRPLYSSDVEAFDPPLDQPSGLGAAESSTEPTGEVGAQNLDRMSQPLANTVLDVDGSPTRPGWEIITTGFSPTERDSGTEILDTDFAFIATHGCDAETDSEIEMPQVGDISQPDPLAGAVDPPAGTVGAAEGTEPTQVGAIPQPVPPAGAVVPPAGAVEEAGSGEAWHILPFGDLEKCSRCDWQFMRPGQLSKHYAKAHGGISLKWTCRTCDRKPCESLHSTICHIPKCRGERAKIVGEHRCAHCAETFRTKIGLGQHRRHAHKDVANEMRRVAREVDRKRDRSTGKVRERQRCYWTSRETKCLLAGLETVVDEERLLELLADHLPFKTPVQIRSRLRSKALIKDGAKLDHQDEVYRDYLFKFRRERAQGLEQVADGTIDIAGEAPGQPDPLDATESVVNLEELLDISGLSPAQYIREIFDGLNKQQIPESSTLDKAVERFVEEASQDGRGQNNNPPRKVKRKGGKKRQRRLERLREYRKVQEMWRRCTKRAAQYILDGNEGKPCPIAVEEVERHFKEKLRGTGHSADLSRFPPAREMVDNRVLAAKITSKEVRIALRRIKRDSAPGPDKIQRDHILKNTARLHSLTAIFRLFQATSQTPECLKESRSILLPKDGDANDIGNWRPLTISSIILRCFTAIMAQRFASTVNLHPRQRGFIRANGCFENLFLLRSVIKRSKRAGGDSGASVCFVDLAKAFDTVSHDHLFKALHRFGVDARHVGLVKSMYENSSTRFRTEGGETGVIEVGRGIKQGDPLSPILFNMALDPLICALEENDWGFRTGGTRIPALAFADDLALVSESPSQMAEMLGKLEEFCERSGLGVNPRKCAAFTIRSTGKTWFTEKNSFQIGADTIRDLSPTEGMKYLGQKISPYGAKSSESLAWKVKAWLAKAGNAPLKPYQKLELVASYILPRCVADLATAEQVYKTQLEGIDQEVRQGLKKFLHLPACAPDGFWYTKVRHGGLGVMPLARVVPSVRIKNLLKVSQSPDEIIRAMARQEDTFQEAERLALDYDLAVPEKGEWARKYNSYWDLRLLDSYHSLRCHTGQKCFLNQPRINRWLRDPGTLDPGTWMRAVWLRSGLYPCNETVARGRPDMDTTCRRCKAPVESLAHIIGQCRATKWHRIKRHDAIVDCLAREVNKEWKAVREAKVTVDGRNYVPDVIFVREKEAHVVDVSVRYENTPRTLTDAHREKVRKYEPLENEVKRLTGATKVTFGAVIVGSRGAWCKSNSDSFKRLGLRRGLEVYLSRIALRSSLEILSRHAATTSTWVP